MCDKIVVSEALMFMNGTLMVYISKNKGNYRLLVCFGDRFETNLGQNRI